MKTRRAILATLGIIAVLVPAAIWAAGPFGHGGMGGGPFGMGGGNVLRLANKLGLSTDQVTQIKGILSAAQTANAPATKAEVVRKVEPQSEINFQEHGWKQMEYDCLAADGVKPDDVLKREYWAHVSQRSLRTMTKIFIGLRLNIPLVYGPRSGGPYRKPRRSRGQTRKKALPITSERVMVPHMRLSQELEWLSPIMK